MMFSPVLPALGISISVNARKAAVFGVAVSFLVGAATRAEEGIPLQNPGFEEPGQSDVPPSGWTAAVGSPHTYTMLEVDGIEAAEGAKGILCGMAPAHAAVTQSTSAEIEPGVSYQLSAKFLSRIAAQVEPGGYWLRLAARNAANFADAHILANEYGDEASISASDWVEKRLSWQAPADLSQVPTISNGITGTTPDGTADLSGASYVVEVLVGGSAPLLQPDVARTAQTWIDDVQLTRAAAASGQ